MRDPRAAVEASSVGSDSFFFKVADPGRQNYEHKDRPNARTKTMGQKASKAMSGQERLSTQGREDILREDAKCHASRFIGTCATSTMGHWTRCCNVHNAALASLALRARESEDECLEGFMASCCLILSSQMWGQIW